MGHAYANYFSITYIICYRKKPKTKTKTKKQKTKKKITVSFPGKKCLPTPHPPPPKSNNFHPVPAASTGGAYPTITGLLLRFYNVQMEWQLCRP